ncbi:hypothetical protein DYY66_2416 [Candidatus Nitrosotalea sp. FS]|nr:hypothetical protein [Candidatus Nitrosotalea sp. FS]
MERDLVCPRFVTDMLQFPISYGCTGEKNMTYEPSDWTVVAVEYVFPVGLVRTPVMEVPTGPAPITWIKSPLL